VGIPDTFNITVNPRPIVVAANDTILCLAQTFVPTTICAQPGTVFSWDNGAVHNQTFIPFQDTTLTVTGIDANLCTNQDSLFVTYLNIPPPQVYGGEDDTLCFGECTTLTATVNPADAFLSWNNGVVQAQEFCPPTTNDYIVTAVSLNGCVERDTVTVIVNPLPVVTAHASDTTLCAGQPLVLWGQGAFTYVWDNDVIDSVAFVSTDSLTYTVIGTDVNGCRDTASITIDVNPIPVVLWSADMPNGGCLPFSPTFTNLSTPSNGVAVWNFGNGATFTDSTQIGTAVNIYDNFGCYPVTLTVTSPEGCTNSLTQQDYICVNQIVASFTPSAFELPITDANFCFTNTSINGATFQWFYGNGNGSDLVHPCETYDDWGTYTVCLVAVAQDGCTDTACQTIRVRDQVIIYVPNSFTPDGNDMNDIFIPVLTSGFDRTGPYEFKIYNRWGHEIFVTNSFTEGWDGTFQGNLVQVGSYTWSVKFKDSQNNEIYEYYGHVNLIR
jgi:gliding motility-associated-like protein